MHVQPFNVQNPSKCIHIYTCKCQNRCHCQFLINIPNSVKVGRFNGKTNNQMMRLDERDMGPFMTIFHIYGNSMAETTWQEGSRQLVGFRSTNYYSNKSKHTLNCHMKAKLFQLGSYLGFKEWPVWFTEIWPINMHQHLPISQCKNQFNISSLKIHPNIESIKCTQKLDECKIINKSVVFIKVYGFMGQSITNCLV
jgi:hypothetical protein